MAILKNKTQNNFTMISNNILRDKNLSMKDRGVMCTICSLPDGWDFSVKGLSAIVTDGADSISNSVKRLEQRGYLKRKKTRNKGKFETLLEVYADKGNRDSKPLGDNRNGKADADDWERTSRDGSADTANQAEYYTDNTKKNINNEDDKSIIHSVEEYANSDTNEGMNDDSGLTVFIESTKRRVNYSRLVESVLPDEVVYVDLLVKVIAEGIYSPGGTLIKVSGVYIDGPAAVSHLLNYKYDEVFAVVKNLASSKVPIDKPKSYYITALDNQLKLNKPSVYQRIYVENE